MDDLDHSISIGEYEWISFYEECEECCLLSPSKADVENSNLSDAEESWSQERSEQRDALQTTAARTNPEEVHLAVELGPQLNQMTTNAQAKDLTAVWEEGFLQSRRNIPLEALLCSEQDVLPTSEVQQQNDEVIKMVNNGIATNETIFVQQSDPNNTQCSADDGAHGMLSDLQRDLQSDTMVAAALQGAEPLSRHEADHDPNQIQCTLNAENTLCGKDRRLLIMKEKERWFVTVNVSPLRRKRRKKKKPSRNFPPCGGLQKPTPERTSELKINKSNEVEGGDDLGPCEPLQHLGAPEASHGIQIPVLADTKQIHEDSSLSDSEWCSLQPFTLETCPLSEAAPQSLPNSTLSKLAFRGKDITVLDSVKSEDLESGQGLCLANICNSRHQTAMLPSAVILKSESIQSLESIESMEFKSAEEFSSSNVSDCEGYASAPDFTEEPWPLFKERGSENRPEDVEQRSLHCSLLLSAPCDVCELSEAGNVPHTDDDLQFPFETPHVPSARHGSHDPEEPMPLQSHGCETQANRENKEAHSEPAVACLPVDQGDGLALENNSTSAGETLNSTSQPSDSQPVGSCSMTTDELPPPAVCDPTDRSDGPESDAESVGHPRPVFAMSAFWDEMEKLTIRDILQLRRSGEQSSREALHIQDTATPHDDEPDTQRDAGPLQNVGCLCSDTAALDPADIADSDYFTNPDDSQPDRSSCDFSTFSDLEEEYCQLLGSGRDADLLDADLLDTNLLDTNLHRQSPAVSPSARDSMENTTAAYEGRSEEQSLDDPHCNRLSAGQTAHGSGIQKSKSTHNVRALSSTHNDSPFKPIPEDGDESAPHLNHLSMQIPLIKVNDVLVDGTFSTILSNTDLLDEDYTIPFPEVFEYSFDENKKDNDFRTVSIYGDQSMTYFCDCTSSRYGCVDGLQASQWREEPIPIFTCSRHSLRELTFPEEDFLPRPREIHVEPDVESGILPVWAASHAPCPGVYPVPSSGAADEALFNNRCWSSCWNSWSFIRNLHYHHSGSSWCGRSGPWRVPVGAQWTTFRGANGVITLTPQRRFASFPHHSVRPLAAEQQMLKLMPSSVSLSEKEGPFSTLKQSDMCLLCFAVASWVLRSTDPQAADSWKAALLANVSAISAIQYLRHYVLRNPAKHGP